MIHPTDLRCEYLREPIGIDIPHPRLSWALAGAKDRRGARQIAYHIVVRQAGSDAIVWDTGRVDSDATAHITYQGGPLQPATRYEWQARVWDEQDTASDWSRASWTTGLWGPGWSHAPGQDSDAIRAAALWIGAPVSNTWNERASQPSPFLRKSFTIDAPIRRAIVYASALGVYEMRINGQRVGDHILAPEWTDYSTKAQYQGYDVTALMREGENVIGAMLGPGWYAGQLGLGAAFLGIERGYYGRLPRFIARLHIERADGQTQIVNTDESWRQSTDGPIRASDILAGEHYDARREMPGWDTPGYDDTHWQPVASSGGPRLVAQPNEPIRITRTLTPIAVSEPQAGVFIFDMGQNMVGWARMTVRGEAGDDIRFRYGEALNPDGTLYRENLRLPDPNDPHRGAQQEDHYICRGTGDATFEPHFTYHGFRYVEVTGLRYTPQADDLTGCVFHSSGADVGRFECSSPLLNKIMSAAQWTQRGNLHSIPTDCPQRDERLGWAGDIQVYSQTAIFNMDMAAFFTKWLRDFREAQAEDGRFPDFAPHPFDPNARFSGNPGWGDAGVIVPWRMYLNYGDTRILEEMFEPACRYIDWSTASNPDLIWRNHSQLTPLWYGDWLNADTFVDIPGLPRAGGEIPKAVYSTAFFAYSARLVSKMAEVLGRASEARRYDKLSRQIRRAFNRAFVSPDGTIAGDTQAGYALALHFDLLPARLRPRAVRHMLAAMAPYGGGLSTGIQSTIRLMLELTRYGYADVAYRLINRTEMPSWGYMVEHGATTIWERWDGWAEGRGFQNPGMNSFNHYAIGAVGEWMWRVIAGINPDESAPGYRHVILRPIPGGGLSWAQASYDSIRGRIALRWSLEPQGLRVVISLPPGVSATLELPAPNHAALTESGHDLSASNGIVRVRRDWSAASIDVEPGDYEFLVRA